MHLGFLDRYQQCVKKKERKALAEPSAMLIKILKPGELPFLQHYVIGNFILTQMEVSHISFPATPHQIKLQNRDWDNAPQVHKKLVKGPQQGEGRGCTDKQILRFAHVLALFIPSLLSHEPSQSLHTEQRAFARSSTRNPLSISAQPASILPTTLYTVTLEWKENCYSTALLHHVTKSDMAGAHTPSPIRRENS